MKEVFECALQGRISLRNNYARIKVHFRKTNMGQKSLIYWFLSLEHIIKFSERKYSLNKLKHDVKNNIYFYM